MIFPWTKPELKSDHFEQKAHGFFQKQNYRQAYEAYKKALFYNESKTHIYEQLLKTMDHFKEAWSETDFVENIYWTMQQKEILDPTFKRIHAQSEPEYPHIKALIHKLIKASNSEIETQVVEDIVAYGENALYPLIDHILHIKEISQKFQTAKSATENTKK